MKMFSKKWLKYQKLLHTKEYREIEKVRRIGVDYSHFDLYKNLEQDYIFIHIPKSAGLAIVKSLTGYENSHHATALDFKKQSPEIFNSCYSFCLAREPIARAYSAYNYLQSGGRLNIYDCHWREKYTKKYKSFDSFVQDGGLTNALEGNAEHFIPQQKYFSENDDCIVDFIGKLENIDEFKMTVSAMIGRELSLDKVNVTVSLNNKAINQGTTRMLQEIYKKDFECLGY